MTTPMTVAERDCVQAVAAHVEALQSTVTEVRDTGQASRAAIEGLRLDLVRLTEQVGHMHNPSNCTMVPRVAHLESRASSDSIRLKALEDDRTRFIAALGGMKLLVGLAVLIAGIMPYVFRAWEAGLFPAPGK